MSTVVLDHGYVTLIEAWGSDEEVISAARMSTGKAFVAWGPVHESDCNKLHGGDHTRNPFVPCSCTPKAGDEKLLGYLWRKRHTTPFEQCGLSVEVQAPIVVFREWHRHRTMAYSELSARYTQMPDLHYLPTLDRLKQTSETNKQAQGAAPLAPDESLRAWLGDFEHLQRRVYEHYEHGLRLGIPREVARLNTPVSRYSRMRASANLLNWLRFLGLRMAADAQFEIRQFANAVGELVAECFPRTWALFKEQPI